MLEYRKFSLLWGCFTLVWSASLALSAPIEDPGGYFPPYIKKHYTQRIQDIQKKLRIHLSVKVIPRLDRPLDDYLRTEASLTNTGVRIFIVQDPPVNRVTAGYHLLRSGWLDQNDLDRIEQRLNLNLPLGRKKDGIGQALFQLEKAFDARYWDRHYPPPAFALWLGWPLLLLCLGLFTRCLYQQFSESPPTHRSALTWLCLSYFGWSLTQYGLYWDANVFLPRENFTINYLAFEYFANYLRFFGQWPTWMYAPQGGLWIDTLSNHYNLILPNRLLGLLLAHLTDLPLNSIWKFSYLFLGQGVFIFGAYLVARELYGKNHIPLFVAAFFIYSGINLGSLHQECFLGSYFYLPYIWLAALRIPKNLIAIPILGSLVGLSFTITYPQFRIAYGYVLGIVLLLGVNIFRTGLQTYKRVLFSPAGLKMAVLGCLCFIISAGPILFNAASYLEKLSSSVRHQKSGIFVNDYRDYLKIDAIDETSLRPTELAQIVQGTKIGHRHPRMLDDHVLFSTCAVPLILLLLCWVPFKGRGILIGLIIGVTVLALGVHSIAPKLLWYILPGIRMFRAWHSFSPYLPMHLTFLVAVLLGHFVLGQKLPTRALLVLGGLLITGSLMGLWPWMWGAIPGLWLLSLVWIPQKPAVRTLFCMVWVFIGSLLWANESMKDYRAWKINYLHFGERFGDSQSFAKSLLTKGHPIFMLADAKGLAPQVSPTAQRLGLLYWQVKDGLTPIPTNQFRVRPIKHGFRFDFGSLTKSKVSLLQYNDGGWKSDTILSSSPWQTIQLEINSENKSFSLQRPPSWWQTLIVVCWFPLLSCLIYCWFAGKTSVRVRTTSSWKPRGWVHNTG